METRDSFRKSLLKKSNSSVINKAKRVTFCSTVKLFIDDVEPGKKISVIDPKLNCVEIKIVDKSSNDLAITPDFSKNDECSETDFLVHKVIYEDELEHEDGDTDGLSEDAEDSLVLFDTSADEEGLQFVVHKVTDHEDDLIQQELEFEGGNESESISNDLECSRDVIGKLSELSIENILTHDKIIALIDQKNLGLSSLLKNHVSLSKIDALPLIKDPVEDINYTKVSCVEKSELVLSPPLQELSLDKIVIAQSNNVLCELDISPLNSIQETDSESDASSEGTMIMMTTEESEKNEQHIRESFLKYQTLKKEKSQIKDSDSEIVFDFQVTDNQERLNLEVKEHVCNDSSFDTSFSDCVNEGSNPSSKIDFIPQQFNEESKGSCFEQYIPQTDKVRSASVPNSGTNSFKDVNFPCSNERRRISFTSMNNSCYWDRSLESVKIPKDVRDWKIILSSVDKSSKSSLRNDSSSHSSPLYETQELSANPTQSLSEMNECMQSFKSDELENFVHASSERVQRIRKRYLEKPQKRVDLSRSSVRGIKPRFGSTAEILHMMHKKNQPPLMTFHNRNHVSWPCDDTITNSEINSQNREQLSHMFGCQILPSEYSLQTSFNSYASDDSSTCDHDSVSSCPSIFFHERGMPEGASPPRSLSDDSIEKYTEDNPNNIVYFSMKV